MSMSKPCSWGYKMGKSKLLKFKAIVGISLAAVLLTSVPLLNGCAAPTPTPEEIEPIRIGAPLPLSGVPGPDAIEMERGMTMAVEEINARGGLLGRRVEIFIRDVVNWGAQDQIAARDYLLQKEVDAFFPGYGFDPAFMDIFAAEETGGIPYLHVGTTELFAEMWASNPDKYWNILQLDDTAVMYGPNVYEIMTEKIAEEYDYPSKTAAILTAQVTYNLEISGVLRDLIEADPEWELVIDEVHPFRSMDVGSGVPEFGIQLAKIREANPGFIFFNTAFVPESAAFVRQFLEDPTDSLIVIQYAPTTPELRKMLGEQAVGLLWQTTIGPYPTDKAYDYRERYTARFGEGPGFCMAYSNYDQVMFWAEAVEAVGDVKDYRGIIDHIMDTHMKGMTYGPSGTNISPLSGTDRTMWREGMPEWDKENRPEGPDYGSSMTFSQIQVTSDGPQDIVLFLYDYPTEEYMLEHYGYQPRHQYIEEVGTEFVLPPWLE